LTPDQPQKLPLWRLIAGILVLATLCGVLAALAPVYLEDYQLRQYMRSLVKQHDAAAVGDDNLRAEVTTHAQQFHLPVRASDIQVSHDGGKLHLQLKYVVQMDFPLYQVDLHLGGGATAP